MVSRRFACLLLAASMTLSSIWIVSADQSHQIQDAAAAAATYSAAVQVLEGAGLSQSAEANAGIAIDMGLLDREETPPTTVNGIPLISMVPPMGFSPWNRLWAVLASMSATFRQVSKSDWIKARP